MSVQALAGWFSKQKGRMHAGLSKLIQLRLPDETSDESSSKSGGADEFARYFGANLLTPGLRMMKIEVLQSREFVSRAAELAYSYVKETRKMPVIDSSLFRYVTGPEAAETLYRDFLAAVPAHFDPALAAVVISKAMEEDENTVLWAEEYLLRWALVKMCLANSSAEQSSSDGVTAKEPVPEA